MDGCAATCVISAKKDELSKLQTLSAANQEKLEAGLAKLEGRTRGSKPLRALIECARYMKQFVIYLSLCAHRLSISRTPMVIDIGVA